MRFMPTTRSNRPDHPPSDTQQAIKRVVRHLMVRDGLRHDKDLADVLGCSASTVSRNLGPNGKLDLDDLERLAAYFDVEITYFFQDPLQTRWIPTPPVDERELEPLAA